MRHFLENCEKIAQTFGISEHDLAPSSPLCKRLADMQISIELIEIQESIFQSCRDLEKKLAKWEGFDSDELYADYLS